MQNLWQVGMKPYETPDFTACFPWPPALLGDANLCKVPLEGLGIKDQCLAVAAPLQQDSRGSKSLFPGGSRKLIRQRHLSPSTHAKRPQQAQDNCSWEQVNDPSLLCPTDPNHRTWRADASGSPEGFLGENHE